MILKVRSKDINTKKCVCMKIEGEKEDVLSIKEKMSLIIRTLKRQGHLKHGYEIEFSVTDVKKEE